jgi:quercetin dioxygenase-like cupin family protein
LRQHTALPEEVMDIRKSGSAPTKRAPAEWFTGSVWQDAILDAPAPARMRSVLVRFDPGARTNWHTHPFGQTLYVVSGMGLVQSAGGSVRRIRAGDVVWFAPGERHWHGASPTTGMSHIAMHETLDGKAAEWFEPVSDADYAAAPEVEPGARLGGLGSMA